MSWCSGLCHSIFGSTQKQFGGIFRCACNTFVYKAMCSFGKTLGGKHILFMACGETGHITHQWHWTGRYLVIQTYSACLIRVPCTYECVESTLLFPDVSSYQPVPTDTPEIFDDQLLTEEDIQELMNGGDKKQKRIILKDPAKLYPKKLGFPNERVVYFDFDFSWYDELSGTCTSCTLIIVVFYIYYWLMIRIVLNDCVLLNYFYFQILRTW